MSTGSWKKLLHSVKVDEPGTLTTATQNQSLRCFFFDGRYERIERGVPQLPQ
jgi:hypothetical protein